MAATLALEGRKWMLWFVLLVIAFAVALTVYLNSAGFQTRVKQIVIEKLEDATGGRVQIETLSWSWRRLELVADGVAIHGSEPPSEAPYFHADRILCRLKILSWFGAELGLEELDLKHPVIHIIAMANGKTNIPVPRSVEASPARVSEVFDLGAEHLEIAGGELIWNEQHIPLTLTANDTASALNYVPHSGIFEGSLKAGKVDCAISGLRPFSSAVQVFFTMARDRITVSSLHLASGGSILDAKGAITNFSDPQIGADYTVALQAQDLSAVARNNNLKNGVLHAAGSAAVTDNTFNTQGSFSLGNAQWRSATTDISNFAARGRYKLTPAELELRPIVATWAGGSIQGQSAVKNWAGYLTRTPVPLGTAQFRFSNLDVESALQTLAPQFPSLRRIRIDSRAAGTVNGAWRENVRSVDATAMVTLTAPQSIRPNYLPANGDFTAGYTGRNQTLSIGHSHIDIGANEFAAQGVLAPANSKLELQVAVHDLRELQPAMSGLDLPLQPVAMSGNAVFSGILTGNSARPTIAGHLEAAHCDVVLQLRVQPASRRSTRRSQPVTSSALTAARHLRWGNLSTDLTIAPDHTVFENGAISVGASQAKFSFSSGLQNYAISENSALQGRIAIANASLADVQNLAGKNFPVSGTMWLNARASGTLGTPNADGNFKVSQGRALGIPFSLATGAFAEEGDQAELKQMRVELAGNAFLSASGAYNRRTRSFKVALDGRHFDLSRLPALQHARWNATGTADLDATAEGTLDAPRLTASVTVHDLVLNGERVGNLVARATTVGAKMHLTAQSDFARSNLTAAGDVDLQDSWPADLTLNFTHLDIDPLLTRYVHGQITEHSSIDGQITLRGPLLTPRLLDVHGILQDAFVDVENVALRSEGPVDFEFSHEAFSVQHLHIVGQQTDFSASGTLPLQNGPQATLRADGRLNLEILKSFDPDMVSYGTTTLNVRVGGSMAAPVVTGQVQVINAGMAPMDYPAGLSSINGTMAFNENRLVIQNLTAQTGGGELALGGFIAYSHGVYFSLTATGKAIRFRYPPGVSASVNPDLRFEGTLQHSLISGEVRITKFGLTSQFDFAYYLARSQLPPAIISPNSLLNTIHFDVHFVTSPALEVETSLAKLTGDADLRLRGTAAQPIVLGRIDIAEGTLSFSGTQYTLDRGSVVFSNPVRILPVLDLQASTRVRDYDITISLHGPLDKLSTTYRSDPPLPPADIIALLALGRTQEQAVLTTGPQQTYPSLTTNQLLTTALNYAQSSRVQRLFGASRIKIDPQAGGPENNPNARLTVEEQVSNRATITYITNLSQSAQEVIQMEFYINRQLSLVGIRDQNGVVSLSIHLRQRKR